MRKLLEPLAPEAAIGRYVSSLVAGGGSLEAAVEFAEKYSDSPEVGFTLRRKAAVDVMDSDGSALASYGLSDRFQILFREASLVGRLAPKMKAAPFNVNVPVDSENNLAGWAAEQDPKPARALSLHALRLSPYKMSAICVMSRELALMSTPAAERVIATSLVSAVSRAVDRWFLSDEAEVAFENPPGIANGQPTHVSTGPTAANIAADVSEMAGDLDTWEAVVFVCQPRTLLHMSALGLVDFSSGTPLLASVPVFTCAASPQQLLLIDLGSAIVADEGRIDLALSRHSHVLVDDGASPPTVTEVSLWQQNLVGVRVEKYISWEASHTDCACLMTVAY